MNPSRPKTFGQTQRGGPIASTPHPDKKRDRLAAGSQRLCTASDQAVLAVQDGSYAGLDFWTALAASRITSEWPAPKRTRHSTVYAQLDAATN